MGGKGTKSVIAASRSGEQASQPAGGWVGTTTRSAARTATTGTHTHQFQLWQLPNRVGNGGEARASRQRQRRQVVQSRKGGMQISQIAVLMQIDSLEVRKEGQRWHLAMDAVGGGCVGNCIRRSSSFSSSNSRIVPTVHIALPLTAQFNDSTFVLIILFVCAVVERFYTKNNASKLVLHCGIAGF